MANTAYQTYHKSIINELEKIKEEKSYDNLSISFAHWYLKNEWKLNDEQIQDAIIDGADDMGLDAVIIDENNNKLVMFQFKFPNSDNQINEEIKQDQMLKTFKGFQTLIYNDNEYNGKNKLFSDMKERVKDIDIYDFEIYFVSFNKGIEAKSNKDIIFSEEKKFKNSSGSDLKVLTHNVDYIINIFDRINRENNVEIEFTYENIMPINDEYNSYYCYIKAKNLISSIADKMSFIFDENIRLYEYNTSINQGIKETAVGDNSRMFYFYNNGIVFICNQAKSSTGNRKISLTGASVVNGCQTLNVLYEIGEQLKDDVFLVVKIIEIGEYNERSNITRYLNSQNQIKGSYFLANHTMIRNLQKELLKKGYFLERQINEYKYNKKHNKSKDDNCDYEIIKLEDTIQYYTACYLDKYAHLAKNRKGELFDINKVDDILKDINADKVIHSHKLHDEINNVIKKYRKLRKNSESNEFSEFLGENVINQGEEFKFLNTSDIILLNITHHFLTKNNCEINDAIKQSIYLIKQVIDKYMNSSALANLTRKKEVYDEVRGLINNKRPLQNSLF